MAQPKDNLTVALDELSHLMNVKANDKALTCIAQGLCESQSLQNFQLYFLDRSALEVQDLPFLWIPWPIFPLCLQRFECSCSKMHDADASALQQWHAQSETAKHWSSATCGSRSTMRSGTRMSIWPTFSVTCSDRRHLIKLNGTYLTSDRLKAILNELQQNCP
jgi:hypothetical protein